MLSETYPRWNICQCYARLHISPRSLGAGISQEQKSSEIGEASNLKYRAPIENRVPLCNRKKPEDSVNRGLLSHMCEWCYKHGAGQKWYLNSKNYLRETALEVGAHDYIFELWKQFDKVYLQRIYGISMKGPGYKFRKPLVGGLLRSYVNGWFRKEKPMKGRNPRRAEGHPGQVVPLEDAKKILELASPILRVNCACRKMTRGINDPCCLAFGALAEMVPKAASLHSRPRYGTASR